MMGVANLNIINIVRFLPFVCLAGEFLRASMTTEADADFNILTMCSTETECACGRDVQLSVYSSRLLN